MRIYITGSTGSGKTTAAARISAGYGIPLFSLDEAVWDNSEGYVGKRFPADVRDRKIFDIAQAPAWVAEGIYLKEWMKPLMTAADLVLLLSPPVLVRDLRMVRRYWIGKLWGKDPKENLTSLYRNIAWGHGYESREKPILLKILEDWNVRLIEIRKGDPLRALSAP